ncbi:MAG: hypothetical protein NZ874_09615 [Fimbriimonadales bacterium]|nr:hypothetical protein [Fimbriimonadales bacterium]
MRRTIAAGILSTALLSGVLAADVLVIATGNPTYDNLIQQALSEAGHTATFVTQASFTGIPTNTQVVYIPGDPSVNWCIQGNVQQAIVNWLNAGANRGLVTTEWVVWCHGSSGTLYSVLPVNYGGSYAYPTSLTYTQATADSVLNAGLPASFSFSGGGGASRMTPKSGATVFYTDDYSGNGVVGWELRSGARVISISAVAYPLFGGSLEDANFRRLLGNAVTWAARSCRLQGDLNRDGVVNDQDLLVVLLNFGNACPPTTKVLLVGFGGVPAVANLLRNAGYEVETAEPFATNFSIPSDTRVVFITDGASSTNVTQIANWLTQSGGRGLVTTEWAAYYSYVSQAYADVLPVTTDYSYSYPQTVTYTRETPNSVIDASLPAQFSFDGQYGITKLIPKPGATVFYRENIYNEAGVAGWELNGSRAISISARAVPSYSLASPEFRQLLVNATNWAANRSAGRCSLNGDVNNDGVVNDQDLLIVLLNFGASCSP